MTYKCRSAMTYKFHPAKSRRKTTFICPATRNKCYYEISEICILKTETTLDKKRPYLVLSADMIACYTLTQQHVNQIGSALQQFRHIATKILTALANKEANRV